MKKEIIQQRIKIKKYLQMRVDMCDWHDVRDATADLEQLEVQKAIYAR